MRLVRCSQAASGGFPLSCNYVCSMSSDNLARLSTSLENRTASPTTKHLQVALLDWTLMVLVSDSNIGEARGGEKLESYVFSFVLQLNKLLTLRLNKYSLVAA